MSGVASYPLRFQIGARNLLTVRVPLMRTALSLEQALGGQAPVLPPLRSEARGHIVNSLPENMLPLIVAQAPALWVSIRQHYVRRYADLTQSFDTYLAGFSARSRSTLLRKVRRFVERSGGTIDIRVCSAPADLPDFYRLARIVSKKSYQERLLEAGLPEGAVAYAQMERLAAANSLRAFILMLDAVPVSYLYLPAIGDTLIYAYLGFDPDHADLSPGTVLQAEAMRILMAEGRFARLDFTEGEGRHKTLFATGGVSCVDALMLRPTLANRLLFGALTRFDGAVAAMKTIADRPLLRPITRAIRR